LKTSRFLVPFLVLAIVVLTGINIYQNRVIAKQSFEIRWLLANCAPRGPVLTPKTPPAPAPAPAPPKKK